MRTETVLDDELMEQARQLSGASTIRALVEEALRTFLEVRSEERRRAGDLEGLEALGPEPAELKPGTSASEILQDDRPSSQPSPHSAR